MTWRTERRRRQIADKGRMMRLMRADQSQSVSVMAYAPPPQASQLADGVARAPFVAQIGADEVTAAAYMPKPRDRVEDGPKTYTLTDATPVYDGSTVCGWTLIAAGGN
ncbi:hypothetical protein AA23498_2641 [Acetobacter nitrogenifigens DSM 23921 = NBRC 105050]|uniref:hypothetical protein n=1 Tax=Acetobacter nitrogenifigens TaxID=285268 RepID=UPI0021569D9A|nr:hypothetical protein [Acetobacter nitrogenifigens]GBQ96451.1 hypothetical protein AA23498_2641 [Acetobacter nitrogenifigens DSM 23921 = NBRC 105050]